MQLSDPAFSRKGEDYLQLYLQETTKRDQLTDSQHLGLLLLFML